MTNMNAITDDWNIRKGEWSDKESRKYMQWSILALEGEYYTPPVSQIKVNKTR